MSVGRAAATLNKAKHVCARACGARLLPSFASLVGRDAARVTGGAAVVVLFTRVLARSMCLAGRSGGGGGGAKRDFGRAADAAAAARAIALRALSCLVAIGGGGDGGGGDCARASRLRPSNDCC